MDRSSLSKVAALALLAATAAACNPMRDTHGYTTVETDKAEVEVGVDTKSTLLDRLGSPSTEGPFSEQPAWYYITQVQERFAFYHPQTVRREVLVVRFDAQDRVSNVDRFGMERGRIVAYNDDRTPTRGRELGIVEQIFGNVGQAAPILDEESQRRERR
jgi:outer membrane protein assembly factor BamE (lipoprotein component of BamABCDE complex)